MILPSTLGGLTSASISSRYGARCSLSPGYQDPATCARRMRLVSCAGAAALAGAGWTAVLDSARPCGCLAQAPAAKASVRAMSLMDMGPCFSTQRTQRTQRTERKGFSSSQPLCSPCPLCTIFVAARRTWADACAGQGRCQCQQDQPAGLLRVTHPAPAAKGMPGVRKAPCVLSPHEDRPAVRADISHFMFAISA